MDKQEDFNVEEFINLNIAAPSNNEETQMSTSPVVDNSLTLWDSYPALWATNDSLSTSDETKTLINFEGASLLGEEYVDPIALLLNRPTPTSGSVEEFRHKLNQRRIKLELLAKNLSKKSPKYVETTPNLPNDIQWSLSIETRMDYKQGPSQSHNIAFRPWNLDFPPLQVHSMFDTVSSYCKLIHKPSKESVIEGPMESYQRSHQLYLTSTGIATQVRNQKTSQEKSVANSLLNLFLTLLPEYVGFLSTV